MQLITNHGFKLLFNLTTGEFLSRRISDTSINQNCIEVTTDQFTFENDNVVLFSSFKLVYSDGKFNLHHKDIQSTQSYLKYENRGSYIGFKVEDLFITAHPDGKISIEHKWFSDWERFYFKSDITNLKQKQIDNLNQSAINIGSNHSIDSIPKIIWMYWDQLNPPNLVVRCAERIKNLHPHFEVHFLNQNSIHNFLDISEFIPNITPTHKSDVIRLMLLQKYGGVWIDSSTVLNISIDQFIDFDKNKNDINGFYMFHNLKNRTRPVIENWFMAAPQNSWFISAWLNNLYPVTQIGSAELLKQLKQREDFDVIKVRFLEKDWEYFLAYLTQQLTMLQHENKLNIKAILADDNAFGLHVKSGFFTPSRFNAIAAIAQDDLACFYPIIKFTRYDRELIDQLINEQRIVKNSFLADLLA